MSNTTMSPSTEQTTVSSPFARQRFFGGRRGRKRREALLAYALLLPAFAIFFTFGLFPLAFALYESTLRGLNRVVGTYDGLVNYVRAIDNLAYVLADWLAVVFVVLAVGQIREVRAVADREDERRLYDT